MAKCKDCLHYEACYAFSKIINSAIDVEKGCEHFKVRTEVVEVVRRKDCKHYVLQALACRHENFNGIIQMDGFCSYGERKDNVH